MLTGFSSFYCRPYPSKTKSSPGFFSKLKSRLFRSKTANPAVTSPPIQPSTRRSGVPTPPQDPASIQRRQAALQQCGLVPVPRKDLSQLEQELDRRFGHVVAHQSERGELSTAEKVRREWETKNATHTLERSSDEITEVARTRSQNGHSAHSSTAESNVPALSPTMTASSLPSFATPRDDESREGMETMITRSSGGISSSSRFGKVSGTSHDSEDLDIVHEATSESLEPVTTEPRIRNSNRDSAATVGSADFEALAEKKRRMSIRVFQSNKRNSGSSSRKSTGSSRWSATGKDYSLGPLGRPKSRGSTLPVSVTLSARVPRFLILLPLQPTYTPTEKNKEPALVRLQPATEQPQSKSRSVIASLGFKRTPKVAPQQAIPALPPAPSPPVRRPTIKVVEDMGSLVRGVDEIEDEESRRLTELAFLDC